jgi:hypothetical protein
MPIDPSIALSIKGPQFDNPMDVQAKAQATQLRNLQLQQAQQQVEQERTLGDLYRTNTLPSGKVNHEGLIQGMASSGLGARIPAYQKQLAESQKAQADLGKTNVEVDEKKFKLMRDRQNASNGVLASLLSRPAVTHEDVIAGISSIVDQGLATPEEGAAMVRTLPGHPEQLRPYLLQKALEGLEAAKRIEMLAPEVKFQDTGGVVQQMNINKLTGDAEPVQSFKKTNTPGELLSAETTRRGQNLSDARARENNEIQRQAVRTQVLETENGVMLVDKGTGLARPASTLDGKPVPGKHKDLTDAQAKANLFGSRMQEANRLLVGLEDAGVKTPSIIKQGVEGIPLVGRALGATANATIASPQQQQVEQAQRDFVNAVLRRESGAVISNEEFDNARKQYFPAVGDSQAVLAQKRRNRELAIQGVLAEVPERKRTVQPAASGDVPDDIAAILKKHGGK